MDKPTLHIPKHLTIHTLRIANAADASSSKSIIKQTDNRRNQYTKAIQTNHK